MEDAEKINKKSSFKNRTCCSQAEISSRTFYGATYLFDRIGEKLGITNDLKLSFPDSYKKLLSLVYYLILEKDSNPSFRFEKWSFYINIHMQKYIFAKKLNYFFLKMMQK